MIVVLMVFFLVVLQKYYLEIGFFVENMNLPIFTTTQIILEQGVFIILVKLHTLVSQYVLHEG